MVLILMFLLQLLLLLGFPRLRIRPRPCHRAIRRRHMYLDRVVVATAAVGIADAMLETFEWECETEGSFGGAKNNVNGYVRNESWPMALRILRCAPMECEQLCAQGMRSKCASIYF